MSDVFLPEHHLFRTPRVAAPRAGHACRSQGSEGAGAQPERAHLGRPECYPRTGRAGVEERVFGGAGELVSVRSVLLQGEVVLFLVGREGGIRESHAGTGRKVIQRNEQEFILLIQLSLEYKANKQSLLSNLHLQKNTKGDQQDILGVRLNSFCAEHEDIQRKSKGHQKEFEGKCPFLIMPCKEFTNTHTHIVESIPARMWTPLEQIFVAKS